MWSPVHPNIVFVFLTRNGSGPWSKVLEFFFKVIAAFVTTFETLVQALHAEAVALQLPTAAGSKSWRVYQSPGRLLDVFVFAVSSWVSIRESDSA